VTARSEPLLWLQLIGLGAIPLELLLVLLLLAGSDPGPFPGLERVLTWAFGAVAPSVLLWRMPPDPFSLLLVCTPVRLRTPDQLAFSQQPMGLPLKLLLASGTALLLPLLWWLDTTSVLATSYALLPTPNRVAALVAVAPLLTLMVWQWQQLGQASVLLGRNHQQTPTPHGAGGPSAATRQPLSLCLGLPWLRLPALTQATITAQATIPALIEGPEGPSDDQTASLAPDWINGGGDAASEQGVMDDSSNDDQAPESPAPTTEGQETEGQDSVEVTPEDRNENDGGDHEENPPSSPDKTQSREPEITDAEFTPLEPALLDDDQLESAAVAIEPEEAAEKAEGSDLDAQIG
jgi:hypothetical protein